MLLKFAEHNVFRSSFSEIQLTTFSFFSVQLGKQTWESEAGGSVSVLGYGPGVLCKCSHLIHSTALGNRLNDPLLCCF